MPPGRSNGVATTPPNREIPPVPHLVASQPPFALATPAFRHRALAALAARAPIGPGREIALAWFLCARLIDGAIGAARLSGAARASRSAAARSWLASAGLPAACRLPLARVMDACGTEGDADHRLIARTVADALGATGDHLDAPARAELEPLTRA